MIVTISQNGILELPLALQEQLHEGDKYKVSMTDTSIVLEKVSQPLTVEEWFQRVEELGPDPDQLSLEEICEIVKEVRRERRTQQC
ncbi:MAG: hypothetical protein KA717_18690 [Woronichinia naegeliana WA131]|jgi:hypothetical protein|uniref:SpoVT-AbrB domain-containing protein n=1 Tax=Woronichinia naegeliana WA131 TaxID=2824559 RepID=A0A977L2L2_9CYAN|nr:MAG: hypothetical protein KA717_18690 [Woronichinia naegeliana WA131]